MKTILEVDQIFFDICLGVTSEERSVAQKVSLKLAIEFSISPKACINDNLEDTICYEKLTNMLIEYCKDRHFKLLEHLAMELHSQIKNLLPNNKDIVQLTACKIPLLPEIKGHFCFTVRG